MEKRACIYARCSTRKQDQSVADQLKEIKLFAQREGYSIVREPFIDEGVSGVDTKKRFAFLRLVKLIESGNANFEFLMVYDISRLSRIRDNDEIGHYMWIFKQHGIRLVTITEDYKDDNSLPSIIENDYNRYKAADYSRGLSTGVVRGMKSRTDKGYWLSCAPYGYKRAEMDASGNFVKVLCKGERKWDQTHHLILAPGDKNEIDVVKTIFRMSKNGAGGLKIANYLNSRKIPSSRGKQWSSDRVTAILRNPVYNGTLRWGRTKVGHFTRGENTWDDSNPNRRFHDVDKWIIRDNAFEAIIDKSTFAEVQKILDSRKCPQKRHEGRPYGSQFLLSGLLYCGICGGRFDGHSGHKKKWNRWTTYTCSIHRTKGTSVCNGSHFNRTPVDGFVLDQIREVIRNHDMIPLIEKHLRDKLSSQSDVGNDERSIKKEIEKCKAGIEGLLDALEDKGNSNRDLVNERLTDKRKQLKELETELRSCQNRKQEMEDIDGVINRIRDKVNDYADYLTDTVHGDWEINELKKRIVKEFLHAAVVSPDRKSVTFYFYKVPFVDAVSSREPQTIAADRVIASVSKNSATPPINPADYRVVVFVVVPDTIMAEGRTWYRYKFFAKKMKIHYTTVVKWAARGRLKTKFYYGTKYVCGEKEGD